MAAEPAIPSEHLEVAAGADLLIPVVVEDEDGGTLTGAEIHWWSAPSRLSTGAAVTIRKSTADGSIEITDEVERKFAIRLDRADTLGRRGRLFHQCLIVDAFGAHRYVLQGDLVILPTMVHPDA